MDKLYQAVNDLWAASECCDPVKLDIEVCSVVYPYHTGDLRYPRIIVTISVTYENYNYLNLKKSLAKKTQYGDFSFKIASYVIVDMVDAIVGWVPRGHAVISYKGGKTFRLGSALLPHRDETIRPLTQLLIRDWPITTLVSGNMPLMLLVKFRGEALKEFKASPIKDLPHVNTDKFSARWRHSVIQRELMEKAWHPSRKGMLEMIDS